MRNRVNPFGEIIDTPARGTVFGNRGCLHDAAGEIVRHHQGKRWISCRLEWKGRRRTLLQPGRYTELFFLDEATALAAGHRPCAECRRADYTAYLSIAGARRADELDARLRAEGRWTAPYAELPDGAMVADGTEAWLVCDGALHRWTPSGYTDRRPLPHGDADVLTPATSVAALRGGFARISV